MRRILGSPRLTKRVQVRNFRTMGWFRKMALPAGLMAAGWLSPWDHHARLARSETCYLSQQEQVALVLPRGTSFRLVEHDQQPPALSLWIIDVESGEWRGWRCELYDNGHPPLILEEKKP